MRGDKIVRALDARLMKQGYYFDWERADRACYFFENNLRHSKGTKWSGKPFVLADFQREDLRRLFGWMRPDHLRRYRRYHCWIPKKNGKSTFCAGLANYLAFGDGEMGAEVYCAANNKDQADIVFSEAKRMVEKSPMLVDVTRRYASSVFGVKLGSILKAIAAKPEGQHGFSPHAVIYDEIHASGDRELYDTLMEGFIARTEPMEVVISTAGDNIGAFSYELWEWDLALINGTLEDVETLARVFRADPEDRWDSPETWKKANPNYGVSCNPDILKSSAEKAKGMPGAMANWKRLHLNIWSQATAAAIDLVRWKRCARKDLIPAGSTIIPEKLEGNRCWGGLDLSSTNDLTSFALAFPWENEQGIDVLVWHWVPEENVAERAKRHRVDYPKWIALKQLYATPGNVVDYTRIEDFIARVAETVNLQDIGYDPRNATDFVQRLQDSRGLTMVEVLPNYKNLSPATKELERLYLSRHLGHNGNPVLTWQASHVVWRSNATGDIMPDKKKSREKIDGIAALVTAIARVSMGKANVSSFETRGVIVI